jgi:hypothetical protein
VRRLPGARRATMRGHASGVRASGQAYYRLDRDCQGGEQKRARRVPHGPQRARHCFTLSSTSHWPFIQTKCSSHFAPVRSTALNVARVGDNSVKDLMSAVTGASVLSPRTVAGGTSCPLGMATAELTAARSPLVSRLSSAVACETVSGGAEGCP